MLAYRVLTATVLAWLLGVSASTTFAGEQFPRLLREVVESEKKRVNKPVSFANQKPSVKAGSLNAKPAPLDVNVNVAVETALMPPGVTYFNSSNVYRNPKKDPSSEPGMENRSQKSEPRPLPFANPQHQVPKPAPTLKSPSSMRELPTKTLPLDTGIEQIENRLPRRFPLHTTEPILLGDQVPPVTASVGDSNIVNLSDARKPRSSFGPKLEMLKVNVVGPANVAEGQKVELGIEVANHGNADSQPFQVRLWIPDEFTITRFDQDAWLDERKRTVTFTLGSIPSKYKQLIRLRGVSHQHGVHQVKAEIIKGRNRTDAAAMAISVAPSRGLLNARSNSTPTYSTNR